MFRPIPTLRACLLHIMLTTTATLAGLSIVSQPAMAAPIVYQFAGTVDSDDAQRGWSAFSGSFTFSSTAVDGIADASTAAYAHAGSPWGLSLSFDGGPALVVSDLFDVLVTDNLGGADQFGAWARTADMATSLSLTLFDFSQTALVGDALPLPAGGLAWSAFSWGSLSYESADGLLQGVLTGMNCTSGCDGGGSGADPGPISVPEPATGPLTALAIMAALATSRRTQRRPR